MPRARRFALALAAPLLALFAVAVAGLAGCGGGGRLVMQVTVQIQGLPAEDVARIRTLRLSVSGDSNSDGGTIEQAHMVAEGELADGSITVQYRPKKTAGVLRFHVSLVDASGREIASGDIDGDLRSKNVLIEIRGNTSDGGPLDGGPDVRPDGGPDGPDGGPTCDDAVACSGTAEDGCCPAACNAATDADCAGCGNGRLEAGETCDPPGSCPTCDSTMSNPCVVPMVTGSAATCNVVCGQTDKVCSNAGNDRCCPMGCTAANDSDCASCGDGVVDPAAGESCDPSTSCPAAASCVATTCWETKEFIGSAATCNARCTSSVKPCSGTTADGCCPPGCNTSPANRDADCAAVCGNGVLEAGEVCDPVASCPTTCAPMGCQLRTMQASGTCQAACVDAGSITACANGDGCCPPACNSGNDNDCRAMCGNRVVESGELCDGNCPTACPQMGCNLRQLAGTDCRRECVDAGMQTACAAGDGCCPTGCNSTNDPECALACGNGIVEPPEACDGNCPTDCPQMGCNLRVLQGMDCGRQCVAAGMQTACVNGDNCCPDSCNANNDSNCTPLCGNSVVESGELCDGNCPAACPQMGCNLRTLQGMNCQRQCVVTATQTACTAGDGCCPGGCNSTNDGDCTPVCGNNVVETGELCDGNCPTMCPPVGCDLRTLQGTGCQRQCVVTGQQTTCNNTAADRCCPSGCTANNDRDCAAVCGNGIVEAGELCDGNCPTSCPPVGCNLFQLTGTMCQRQCVAAGTQMTCNVQAGDSCCPAGCNATNDRDCAPVCGNSVVESGESCDPVAACTAEQTRCNDDPCNIGSGSPSNCTFRCMLGARACGPADRCCPTNCTADPDCQGPPPNDMCEKAPDISTGGTFPADLVMAQQDSPESCSPKGPDVFFRFQLDEAEWVFLGVVDRDNPQAPVAAAVELYPACPAPQLPVQLPPLACADPDSGKKRCGGEGFPVIDSGGRGVLGKPLEPGKYVVAVRALATPGNWTLVYHHVPLTCAGVELLPTGTSQSLVSTTCRRPNIFEPGCARDSNEDVGLLVVKCPNRTLQLTTCSDATAVDSVLSVMLGSQQHTLRAQCAPIEEGAELACKTVDSPPCPSSPGAVSLANIGGTRAGLMVVSLDTQAGTQCGRFDLRYAER